MRKIGSEYSAYEGCGLVMLKYFSVKNSYSFGDKVIFDMKANTKRTENDFVENDFFVHYPHKNHEKSRHGLLPVAAIYGGNANGKTNVIRVLEDISTDVMGRFNVMPPEFKSESPFKTMFDKRVFKLRKELDKIISYEICVVLKNHADKSNPVEYTLSYDFGENGVVSEKLSKKIFGSSVEPTIIYAVKNNVIKDCNSDEIRPYLKTLREAQEPGLWFFDIARRKHISINHLYLWFMSIWSRLTYNKMPAWHHQTAKRFSNIAKNVAKDSLYRQRLIFFLQELDSSIVDVDSFQEDSINAKEKVYNKEGLDDSYRLHIFHRVDDSADDSGLIARSLDLNIESDGILKLIELFPTIYHALENGLPFVCDELDMRLHQEAFLRIVKLFNHSKINVHGSQLIFTAHNTIIFNSDYIRRDEIHILAKDNNSLSKIIRLDKYRDEDNDTILPHENFEELYRNGSIVATHDKFLEGLRDEFVKKWSGGGLFRG